MRPTKAQLDAITPANDNAPAWVLSDPDPTKNGYYYRSSGAWVRGRGFPDTFAALAADVYEWAAAGAPGPPPFPTFDDGHREVLLCEAIARSARSSAWVEVDDD